MLEFAAERGFVTAAVRNAQIRVGESYAGRAALERQLVEIQDLREGPDNLSFPTHLDGEDFVCYFGEPLIAKGQVKGVLKVSIEAHSIPIRNGVISSDPWPGKPPLRSIMPPCSRA